MSVAHYGEECWQPAGFRTEPQALQEIGLDKKRPAKRPGYLTTASCMPASGLEEQKLTSKCTGFPVPILVPFRDNFEVCP
jgi:hypothetical protein